MPGTEKDPVGLCDLAPCHGSPYLAWVCCLPESWQGDDHQSSYHWFKDEPHVNEETPKRIYLDYQCDTFKIHSALVYQISSKMFIDMDAYVYMTQRKSMQDGWARFFNVHKWFLRHDHVARQATEVGRKLQTSHYDSERKGWDLDKYIALHKKQHAIM